MNIVLLIISIACFYEAKKERKGLRFILSITSTIILSLIMEGTAHSLVEAKVMEGTPLIILYFALPIVFFITFQLLFYDIRMIDER
ncbi:hypothetical protein GCM10011351_29360 [Paraliobacillus quinghaiensis]|uniref:Uncharacterized protein n=1 Tax=Paraliobacillus quinghaiensis TaxID=470815 RepID=A0A917WYI5_9BACI|nr:hypothetical protein GCM10011351_29360 [Paraliobacillus quinghaiensis]